MAVCDVRSGGSFGKGVVRMSSEVAADGLWLSFLSTLFAALRAAFFGAGVEPPGDQGAWGVVAFLLDAALRLRGGVSHVSREAARRRGLALSYAFGGGVRRGGDVRRSTGGGVAFSVVQGAALYWCGAFTLGAEGV